VITRQRLKRSYDGSLFYQLAAEVAARRPEGGPSQFDLVRSGLEQLY
jgi:hypothetical protein